MPCARQDRSVHPHHGVLRGALRRDRAQTTVRAKLDHALVHGADALPAQAALAFWATAWSFELFGVGELSARLPSIVAALGTALLLYMLVKRQSSESQAGTSTILYLTLALVIHTAGAMITDPILTLCTTAVMTGFWLAVQHRQRRWGDVMWVALGLGLMTKGPIALIMPGLACAAWVAIRGEWRAFFTAFHWITGPALMLIVGVPWYIFAEQATSGFLE